MNLSIFGVRVNAQRPRMRIVLVGFTLLTLVTASLVTTSATPALAEEPAADPAPSSLLAKVDPLMCHNCEPDPPAPVPATGCDPDIGDRVDGRNSGNRRSGTLIFWGEINCFPATQVVGRVGLDHGHVTSGPVHGSWINGPVTSTARSEGSIPLAQLVSTEDIVRFTMTLTAPPGYIWTSNRPTTPSGAHLQCGPFGGQITHCTVTRHKTFRPYWYVSLGDSYSAGTGTTGSEANQPCQRTNTAYPALYNLYLDGLHPANVDFTPLACHGATTGTMYNDQLTQLAQRSLGGYPDLLTVTIGGNDPVGLTTDNVPAGFRGILVDCITRLSSSCDPSIDTATAISILDNAYAFIRQRTGPNSNIWVLQYPQIIPIGTKQSPLCPAFGSIDATEADRLRNLWSRANSLITERARRAGFQVINTEDALAGHELCSPNPWAVDLTVQTGYNSTAFHPNAAGHVAMYNAMR